MNALSSLLFPSSTGRIETGTELAMPDLRRMRNLILQCPWAAPRHRPKPSSRSGLKRLRARDRLTSIKYGGFGLGRPSGQSSDRREDAENNHVRFESQRPGHGGLMPSPASPSSHFSLN